MARIALVSFYNYPSLPVRLLHSILVEAGHDPVSVFFKRHRLDDMGPPTEAEYELLHQTIKEIDPLFVGLSLRSTYATVAKRVATRLRSDGHKLLWGGTHATMAPEDCVDFADAVCVGEGEGALLDVAARLAAGNHDLAGIPNLWVKQGADVVKTPQRPQIQDLDTLPMAWYQDQGTVYIEGGEVAHELPSGYMTSYDTMTSRGCPFRCEFCCHSVLVDTYRGLGKYNRRRSPELVVRELEDAITRYPTVNRIRFWDDVFTATPKAWLEEFRDLYKARVGLPFWCYTTSDLAKPELIQILSDAGMRYVGMGIQSGSYRIRKELFNRPETTEEILKANEVFKQFDVHPEFDLIVDNPFETEADYQEALDLLLKLQAPYSLFQHHLTYFPNYPMTAKAIAAGYLKPEEVEHLSGHGYKTWHDEFSSTRDPRYMFWITIFWLIQYPAIPRQLIRRLAGNAFLRAHPRLFNQAVRPFARVVEKSRWAYLYIKERGLKQTLWRFATKRRQLQGDRTTESILAGAD